MSRWSLRCRLNLSFEHADHASVKIPTTADNFFALSTILTTSVAMSNQPPKTVSLTPDRLALLDLLWAQEEEPQPPITKIPRRLALDTPPPLSYAQQRLWFLHQLDSHSTVYNIPYAVRLHGLLNIPAFEQSLNEIVRRHDILRTTFTMVNGNPVQTVLPYAPWKLPFVALPAYSHDEQIRQIEALIAQATQHVFDITTGPLYQISLIKIATDEHVLVANFHHIIFDDWSLGVLLREIAAAYDAACNQKPLTLSPLPIQYSDYAEWQRQWLADEQLEKQLTYWKEQLADAPTFLNLPTDRNRPPMQTFNGAMIEAEFPAATLKAVNQLARQEGATLFMVLLAALNTLFARYTGQTDILIGSPIANRTRPELESLIGFFVNTLVLRTHWEHPITFREMLAQVRQTTLDAYAHQDLPFEQLVAALQPERNLSTTPFFQVMLVLQNVPQRTPELHGLKLEPWPLQETTAKFDLTLYCIEHTQGLEIRLEYNTDLFDAATIERLVGHLQTVLNVMSEDPEQFIANFPLLSADELHQITVEWNDTQTSKNFELCPHELFERQARSTPEAIAVICDGERLTYAQLDQRANQLAHCLHAAAVGPEVAVCLCAERSLDMVIGILGILKAGGIYVPLDPDYPPERLAYMLQDATPRVILTQQHLVDKGLLADLNSLFSQQEKGLFPPLVCLDSDWPLVVTFPETPPVKAFQPDNAIYITYTSGSTGKPKGVINTHRGLTNFLGWLQQVAPLTNHDRVMQKTTFSFDVSFGEIFWPLTAGATLVVAKPDGHKDAAYMAQLIAEMGITTMHFVPSMLQVFVDELARRDLPTLKRIIATGEALPANLLSRVQKHSAAALFNLYGPTEAAIDTVAWECTPLEPEARVPIGKPISNIQTYILDDQVAPTPVGVIGELYLGGVGLARGYRNRPGLTAECFIPNPFYAPDAGGHTPRLYRTGDLARYRTDGTIEYLGRRDFQVKMRGFRIELSEIEAVLNQHPAVRDAVVTVYEPTSDDKRLVAYFLTYTAGKDAAALFSDLQKQAQRYLPDYMVPAYFVRLEQFPLTNSGKVNRRALPAPDISPSQDEHIVLPQTETEAALLSLWQTVLGLPTLSVTADFFQLGGHSLLATRLVAHIRQVLGWELPLQAIFTHRTVRTMGAFIEAEHLHLRGDMPPILTLAVSGPRPLSYAQQRLWFLDQLEGPSATYNMPVALHLRGPLQPDALRDALTTVVERQHILRTCYTLADGEPVQQLQPATPFLLPLVDLSALSEAEVTDLITAEAEKPFDLARDLMLRGQLLRRSATDHILLLTVHHIASDAISNAVLFEELSRLYIANCTNQQAYLTELPYQYADYAAWQRAWLQGDRLQAHLDFWHETLAGLPALHNLSTDFPRPAEQDFRGKHLTFSIDATLSDALEKVGQQTGATLFMTLHTAFALLLARYSGETDIVIGTPVANRPDTASQALIGQFINTVVLRTDLSGEPTFLALLERVRQSDLQALAHQAVPFDMLVESVQPVRSPSHAPLFQILLALDYEEMPDVSLSGLQVETLEQAHNIAKYDLGLNITHSRQGLIAEWEYASSLFTDETVTRMAHHFINLLHAIEAEPEGSVARLPWLAAAERTQLLEGWNNRVLPLPPDLCLHWLFEAQVARTPDHIAVVYDGQTLTYADLNRQANRLAYQLIALGMGPEHRVGLCVPRSLMMVTAVMGVLKAGAAYVPLDPALPPDRFQFILSDADITVLLTTEALPGTLRAAATALVVLLLDRVEADPERWDEHNPQTAVRPQNLAYMTYTSGSTGLPKGVLVPHAGVCNFILSESYRFNITETSRLLQFASLSFDAAMSEIGTALCTGARLYLPTPEQSLPGPAMLALLQEAQMTHVKLPPSALALFPETALSHVQLLVVIGEACPPELVRRWSQQRRFVNGYGPTEFTIGATLAECTNADRMPPIGRPYDNCQVYLLDKYLQPVPVGVVGEIYLGGIQVTRGYHNNPALTAAKFVPNAFADDGHRLYKTGDLARYHPDGNLEFVGRTDRMVKLRGIRIELGEIESVLRPHPSVRDVRVVLREDEPGQQLLVAYIITGIPEDLTPQLLTLAQEHLPGYMIPSAFVYLDAFPVTTSGKVDEKALPLPDYVSLATPAYEPPTTPTEVKLSPVWQKVLGQETVSVTANFFQLGGHSLLAVRLVAQIRDVLQIDLPLRAIFEHTTIRQLARWLDQAGEKLVAKADPILPVPRDQPLPASFAQQRLWFLDQLEGPNATYNMPAAWHIVGPLDYAALEQAVTVLLERHESLRTTFGTVDGLVVQYIQPALPVHITFYDLQTYHPEAQEAHRQRIMIEEAMRPFDLSSSPLWRVSLLRLAPQEHLLSLTLHHIAADGWSMNVLQNEVQLLYQAFCDQRTAPLAPLPIQYADYAVWQRQQLTGESLAAHLAFWQEQLADLPLLQALPTDYPRPAIQDFRGEVYETMWDGQLMNVLRTWGEQQNGTLFMVLQAAFTVLLARYSQQTDIVLGTTVANRPEGALHGLIGFFVNTLVLRHDLSGKPDFLTFFQQVRETTLDVYSHQVVPFEMLVEHLQPERALSHSPLVQILINYEDNPPGKLELRDVTITPVAVEQTAAKYDLVLSLSRNADGSVAAAWQFASALFKRDTITRMAANFETLLRALMVEPTKTVWSLPFLSTLEEHIIAQQATSAAATDSCVDELFVQQVQRTPAAAAIIFEQQQLTYAELNQRANRVAHHLRRYGIGPETAVAIAIEPSIEMLVGVWGIIKAGGYYVPLDLNYPANRLAFILADSQPTLILTEQKHRHHALWQTQQCPVIALDEAWPLIAAEPDSEPFTSVCADHAVYCLYTSGSTGQPKGTIITHRNLVNHNLAMIPLYDLKPEMRFMQFFSLSFDASAEDIFPTLLSGATLVCQRHPTQRSFAEILDLCHKEQLTTLHFPAAWWHQFVDSLTDENRSQLASVRVVAVGGELPQAAALQRWQQMTQAGSTFLNVYGPTETTITVTVKQIVGDLPEERISIGRPLANTQVYVLDNYLERVPVGVVGELCIGGLNLARGYLNRPGLTADRYIPNPFAAGERLYRTGDLVSFLPNGEIEFIGRIDHQVKLRGFRIELDEIEVALYQNKAVAQAVLQVIETPHGPKLVAWVVPLPDDELNTQLLREFLATRLPAYMIPEAFVILDTLPLTSNGKVDRTSLPQPSFTPVSGSALEGQAHTEIQRRLVDIWRRILEHEQVGIHDNFFALGGHSLLVARLHHEIRHYFDTALTLRDMFLHPTIAELAHLLERDAAAEAWSCLIPLQTANGDKRLFCLHPDYGTHFVFEPVAKHLGPWLQVHGVIAQGLQPEQKPLPTITAMAESYRQEIQALQPKGPYYLCGYSFGGLVGFELAHQLLAQGEQVKLIVLDTFLELDIKPRSNFELLADYLTDQGAQVIAAHPDLLTDLPTDHEIALDILLERLADRSIFTDKAFIQRQIALMQSNFTAFNAYQPQKLPGGQLYLIRAEIDAPPGSEPDLGWQKLAHDTLAIHWMKATHRNLADEPHAAALAQIILACLGMT